MQSWRSVMAALFLTFLACTAALAQTVSYPPLSSIDSDLGIRAEGLPSGANVALRTAVVDADGRLWTARAEFRTDGTGTVDTGSDPSLGGSYRGVEATGLFNQMQAVGDSVGQHRFPASGLSPLVTTIALEDAAGGVLDSLVVERFFVSPDVEIAPVSVDGLRGRLYIPARPGAPGIVVLGGSEGGFPDDAAALLATNGYFALSLAYFGADSLPSELAEIPLEYFARAIEWLRVQPGVSPDRVGLFGTSKGAEAALLVASHVPEIRAVVAYAPSSVAWSCICEESDLPSWTFRGNPVASVPPGADPAYSRAEGEPLRPTVNYLYRLRQAPPSAAIPVEDITGPLLLVAGGDDQLWPSSLMAEAIMERRAATGGHPDDELLTYPNAGHLIGKATLPAGSTRISGGRLESGGAPPDNARAQADAWPRVLAFLEKILAS